MNEYTCKYFSGVQHDKCNAGVAYDDVTPDKERLGSAYRRPCIQWERSGRNLPPTHVVTPKGVCEKFCLPTAEELAADKQEWEKAFARMDKVNPLIIQLKREHKSDKDDWSGTVTCPVCGGKLHIGISSYNKHSRGRCETVNYVAWIE